VDHDARFAELVLDEDALHTPRGAMPLSEITRAEFVRAVVSDGPGVSTSETSAPAVVGGAIVGGALLGAAGAVAGGLLGSTVKHDVSAAPTYHTESVKIVFETNDLVYSMDIPREQEMEANHFAQAVRKAAKRSR
jgi:outer membrane lipoprotein SlyB